MLVFKTFFKIARKYIGTTICFAIVFLVISITLTNQSSNNSVEDFKNFKLSIALFDHDDSQISKSLCDYLSSNHDIVECEEDIDTFRDEMYVRNIHYILIIPSGFASALENADNIENPSAMLESYRVSSYAAQFADMQINKFISTYLIYAQSGTDAATAYENTLKTIENEVNVTVLQESAGEEEISISMFYQCLPYVFISSIVSAISPILIAFNKAEIQKRTFCSCVSPIKYNLSLISGASVFTIAIFALYVITSFVLSPEEMLSTNGLLMIINALLTAITALAFGYLFAQLTDSMNIISALSNIFGLGSCFLCGVFVPRELLGEGVTAVGRFLPAHWYINVNNAIASEPSDMNSIIITGYLIQVLFIVALFTLGIVANRMKNKK